jgi:hypothetical protein
MREVWGYTTQRSRRRRLTRSGVFVESQPVADRRFDVVVEVLDAVDVAHGGADVGVAEEAMQAAEVAVVAGADAGSMATSSRRFPAHDADRPPGARFWA